MAYGPQEHTLGAGIRGFELFTLADPNGGAYAYSAGLKLAGATNTLISPDMLKPGIKVRPIAAPHEL